jgi:hypothetical protein
MPLPSPAQYFPIRNGRYEVSPGLHPLGKDFGNGPTDGLYFQFDDQFSEYRQAKLAARLESLPKYFQIHELSPQIRTAAAQFLAMKLAEEHPPFFHLQESIDGRSLECELTQERLLFDRNWDLIEASSTADPPYACSLDALCSQIQEDAAITVVEPGRNWLAAVHLGFPNHWSPAEKIGKDFNAIHEPVASFGPIARNADVLLQGLMTRGPFVRFAWGLSTGTRLNHHPEPPPSIPLKEWKGRGFEGVKDWSEVFMRIERQVLTKLPDVPAFLFLIRTYFRRCSGLDKPSLGQLMTACTSMTESEQAYKGTATLLTAMREWRS